MFSPLKASVGTFGTGLMKIDLSQCAFWSFFFYLHQYEKQTKTSSKWGVDLKTHRKQHSWYFSSGRRRSRVKLQPGPPAPLDAAGAFPRRHPDKCLTETDDSSSRRITRWRSCGGEDHRDLSGTPPGQSSAWKLAPAWQKM